MPKMKQRSVLRTATLGLLLVALLTGCDSRQVRINSDNLLHSGRLRGYAEVYIQDYEKECSYYDNNTEEEIDFPVYEKDGSFTIEYRGTEYTLRKLETPELLLGTDFSYANYSFKDGIHFIIDIPKSY